MSLTKPSLAGNNLLIPRQGEFGYSDIPAADGKTSKLFLQCTDLIDMTISVDKKGVGADLKYYT